MSGTVHRQVQYKVYDLLGCFGTFGKGRLYVSLF